MPCDLRTMAEKLWAEGSPGAEVLGAGMFENDTHHTHDTYDTCIHTHDITNNYGGAELRDVPWSLWVRPGMVRAKCDGGTAESTMYDDVDDADDDEDETWIDATDETHCEAPGEIERLERDGERDATDETHGEEKKTMREHGKKTMREHKAMREHGETKIMREHGKEKTMREKTVREHGEKKIMREYGNGEKTVTEQRETVMREAWRHDQKRPLRDADEQ